MKSPLVSVVILNLNGKELLRSSMRCVLASEYENLEVIVVDNGSTDGSQEMVKNEFPLLNLIENKTNLGYGEGNNVGIRKSRGEFILLLNNDAEVDRNCICELLKAARKDEKIGILGCKVYFADSNLIQHAGGKITNSGAPLIGYLDVDTGQFEQECDVDWVIGAAFMVRRKVFDTIGLFDPIYTPIHYDDVDLCYRADKSDFRVVYVPRAIAYHHEKDISRVVSKDPRRVFLRNRNRLIFIFKNFPVTALVKWPIYELQRALISASSGETESFSFKGGRGLLKAYLWIISNLNTIIKSRLTTQARML